MDPRTHPALRMGLCAILFPVMLAAQDLPLKSVTLFSSGVGYFERQGELTGDVTLHLPFSTSEIDDVLKSLVVRDYAGAKDVIPPGNAPPSVSYPALESTDQALRKLHIDLSGSPTLPELLERMKGAEVAVDAPKAIIGRILSVEERAWPAEASAPAGAPDSAESLSSSKLVGRADPYRPGAISRRVLVLLTEKGIRALPLDSLESLRFTDPAVMADFNRALDLILGARVADRRGIDIHLPGGGSREAAIGYVIAAPVWKATYRLDLSGPRPWFQGWAIVDNPGEDWKNLSLSLVSGRPVSFIQNLYAPLMIDRPVLPLAIGLGAEARSYAAGMGGSLFAESQPSPAPTAAQRAAPALPSAKRAELMAGPSLAAPQAAAPQAAASPASGGMSQSAPRSAFDASGAAGIAIETRPAGDQFEFTIASPVSLEGGHSAMLGLVASPIAAEKLSIYTADSGESNPMLGVRITNSLGMKLPAGPVTVFDGGTYGGDALLDFFPEKDKRLIVYGQDLAVVGRDSRSSARETTGVKVSKGVLTFTRRITFTRSYEFRNASSTPRKLIIEHPVTPGADLVAPTSFEERTGSLYRFALDLPAAGSATLQVVERAPSIERVLISDLGGSTYLAYAASTELPRPIRDAMKRAADLAAALDGAKQSLADLASRRNELVANQARIRQNLEAVGKDSSQGQDYLKRLMGAESALDDNAMRSDLARKAVGDAQNALDAYVGALELDQ